MKTLEKAIVIEALAGYNAEGSEAIKNAYEEYKTYGWKLSYDEFYNKIDFSEVDSINYMYNTEKEEWADTEEMAQEFDRMFN